MAELSAEQIAAILKATSSQEVLDICAPNYHLRRSVDETVKEVQAEQPSKPKYKSVNGFLIPNSSEEEK